MLKYWNQWLINSWIFFKKNFHHKIKAVIFFFPPNDQANKKTPSKSNGKRPSSADNNKTESSACVLQWAPLLFPWWYSINLHIDGHWNMNEILIFNLNNYGSVLKLSVIKRDEEDDIYIFFWYRNTP